MNRIEKITSRDNQRLVNARKVRDGKIEQQIFIEGRRLADEALRSDLVIDECFLSDNFTDNKLLEKLITRASYIAAIPSRLLSSIADTKQPQGIILTAKRQTSSIATIESGLKSSMLPLVLFLNEINNPANLGAVLRTAEAAGIAGVVISTNSADVFSPKSLRAAMGAAFRLPIVENMELENILEWSRNNRLISCAAAAYADKKYSDIDWEKPRLLVFGSEAHGLNAFELRLFDEGLRIPMENGVESLNLAVSAGVVLFEARRQIIG